MNYFLKNNCNKYCLIIIVATIHISCISTPQEGKYKNYEYENLIKKLGKSTYDNTYIVDNNSFGSEIEPVYPLFFTEEELKNTVQIRKVLWEKPFNKIIIVWLKYIEGQWITFDSLEYNNKYIHF